MRPSPERLRRPERLKILAERLRVDPQLTPARLAQELHVSERTIFRDLRALEHSSTFIKRFSRREGRYLLESEAVLPSLPLTPSETEALLRVATNGALIRTSVAATLRSALEKLHVALDYPRQVPVRGSSGVRPDAHRQHLVERLRRAMRSHCKVQVCYWDTRARTLRTLTLSPYDLRLYEGRWVLTAGCRELGGPRRFLIRLMQDVEVLTARFRYPRHFSADTCFAQAFEPFGGDRVSQVTLRFAPGQDYSLLTAGQHVVSAQVQPDGSHLVVLSVADLRDMVWWILSFGNCVELLAPAEAREEMARIVRTLADQYATQTGDRE
ncbi:MAG: WYL domain-containing protein [Chloroherpetonaceae bacterium]|nr:transcriptional regulator [Chthonomonadaceae bacterium]MDW8208820.1 WYL domain-containing protein [Chloroherpetonaceae bacterium]